MIELGEAGTYFINEVNFTCMAKPKQRERCPVHGVYLDGEWVKRGMCPVCWATRHPLQGYCMLCAEPTRDSRTEHGLCDEHEREFVQLFYHHNGKLRHPITTTRAVRELMNFVALRIWLNIDELSVAARKIAGTV